MPSLNDNLDEWGERYEWPERGDEWSEAWGGVPFQWWLTLFPRMQAYVPVGRMLEIAPGYGRWTHFLRDLCDELIIVDIAESAIAHCRERFADDRRVSAHVNDGTSLAMASDASIDFIFSCDSLVHVDPQTIGGYLAEFARVFTPNGVAFIHHSNMGSYRPGDYDPADNVHWRDTSVSAAVVEQLAISHGLSCVSQEQLNWGGELVNDCFSVITRAGSRWDRGNVVVENRQFVEEIQLAHRLSTQYPPFGRDIRIRFEDPHLTARAHADALALHADNRPEAARALLYGRLQHEIGAEALNDLAALTGQCGNPEDAATLLRALLVLHPGQEVAAQNLKALEARIAAGYIARS